MEDCYCYCRTYFAVFEYVINSGLRRSVEIYVALQSTINKQIYYDMCCKDWNTYMPVASTI